MAGYSIILFGPPDEPSSTLEYAYDREEALDAIQDIADFIERRGHLPVEGDIAWPVPAAVVKRFKNGKVKIRCDSFERETGTGYTQGFGTIEPWELMD